METPESKFKGLYLLVHSGGCRGQATFGLFAVSGRRCHVQTFLKVGSKDRAVTARGFGVWLDLVLPLHCMDSVIVTNQGCLGLAPLCKRETFVHFCAVVKLLSMLT